MPASLSFSPPPAAFSLPQNLCPRCLLRFQPPNPSLFPTSLPSSPNPPCPLCFNILHENTISRILHSLPPLLSPIRHSSCISLSTSFPISASLLRPHILRAQVSLREALKWSLLPRLTSVHNLSTQPEAELSLSLMFNHLETEREGDALEKGGGRSKRGRWAMSARKMSDILETASVEDVTKRLAWSQFQPVETEAKLDVNVAVERVLMGGRYIKKARNVSQTPWFVDSGEGKTKRTQKSVEEAVITGIKREMRVGQNGKVNFVAGGREDVDVRMLGEGRPFVVEIDGGAVVGSRVTQDMIESMMEEVGDDVKIEGLKVVGREWVGKMKEVEGNKRKSYRCVVWTRDEMEEEHVRNVLHAWKRSTIKQKTPLRVLHRRTQMVRDKEVYEMNLVRCVTKRIFVMDVVAGAGTYIKELVHGDCGRTKPNVAELLGCEADILQLDVMGIRYEDEHGDSRKPEGTKAP